MLQIGRTHGTLARTQIEGSIAFYATLFQETAKLDWARVRSTALEFEPVIRRKWPAYLEEMRGIAEGAGVELSDVLALNVRTEIAFGLFTDGCTMLAWHSGSTAIIAQNWDWRAEQRSNLIALSIVQDNLPSIKMITEGGIIGKIGFNSAGVGCTLNAIRAIGMDPTRMPCHLALRAVLESPSKDAAVATIEKHGVASSCTISIADAETGSVSLEWSATDVQKLFPDGTGRIYHSNHYLVDHPGVKDTVYLPDSIPRVKRIRELSEALGKVDPTVSELLDVFKDEQNFPKSINRKQVEARQSETLFNIICDLKARKAYVTEGRPTEAKSTFTLEL
ncbi:Acyl-coenzyme A:6-aminopenicillanic-acid-acyltransferase 40 kDa form [Lasiodiplodia hormozganensis]|uniref:Acyl-coenzyme A:6-aminopenicillanic-acid-acyltransferase 40 kDa form n=1 Tax=Lasiodiplodia hormozganensis TaxID=869390 RepID=A0AA39Z3B3_9PEZI|nr:Acyl-coenzyme A:6-aminopenicillanic-acid-acyltransferase 40 kDa form [Lasiodiplodia hormozganensis]